MADVGRRPARRVAARHDMARRMDCGFIAGQVAGHRLTEDEGMQIARYLVTDQPKEVFGL